MEGSISNFQPFVGEQLTYSFSLTQSVQITDAQFTPPAFNGFTVKEIEKRDSEKINNHPADLYKYIDFALDISK